MIYKRATQQLIDAGIYMIVIRKGLWGASPHQVGVRKQTTKVFKTPGAAAKAVIEGFRPTVTEQ